MNEQSFAICGVLYGYKALADGSLRVTIDLDEKQIRQFHELFPAVHGFVALAPLAEAEKQNV
jgi:hypothetical protein